MKTRRRRIATAVLSAAILLLGSFAQAQSPADRALKPVMVNVDVVLVSATVTDPRDRFVQGLEKEHFRVWEDRIEQEIVYFSSEDVPASFGIVFDVSGSMKEKLSGAHEAAATFLKGGNPDDEYFLIEFSERPQITQDFTSDIRKLQGHLTRATQAQGMTALYDAVYLALNKLKEGRNSKKALLIITDGEDNRSRYHFSEVREFIKEQDVQLYAIGIVTETNSQLTPGAVGRAALEELVGLTGGTAFFPESLNDLQKDCAKIALELKNQYVIGYKSTNETKDGKWRKLRVELVPPKDRDMPKLGIRAKNGYYAASGDVTADAGKSAR